MLSQGTQETCRAVSVSTPSDLRLRAGGTGEGAEYIQAGANIGQELGSGLRHKVSIFVCGLN